MGKPLKVFYSVDSRVNLSGQHVFGAEGYTYHLVAKRFVNVAESLNVEIQELKRPEIYKSRIARQILNGDYGVNGRYIHLVFKAPNEIRLLDHAYNIAVIYWEFNEVLTKSPRRQIPTEDQARMLGLADEVWVSSSHAYNVLANAGLRNIHVVPCSISISEDRCGTRDIVDVIGDCRSVSAGYSSVRGREYADTTPDSFRALFRGYFEKRKPKVFLAVLNIWDRRKNLANMVGAFAKFHEQFPDTALVVKLIMDNEGTTIENVNNVLKLHYAMDLQELSCKGVYFIGDYLQESDMGRLLSSADYYLCLSRGEGQCLPLLEAMSVGTVPVSVDNTAMADYITEETSYIVMSAQERIPEKTSELYGFHPDDGLYWYEFNEESVFRQMEAAVRADAGEWLVKSEKCKEIVKERYSDEAVGRIIKGRLRIVEKGG